jgi:hypothetical protein
VALLAGCGGSSGSGGSGGENSRPAVVTPRVDALISRAAPAIGGPKSGPCPLSYNLETAARSAGITSTAAPGLIDAETSDSADPDSFLRKVAPAVSIECDYTLGGTKVTTYLLATGTARAAVSGAVPEVAFLAESMELESFISQATTAQPGKVVPAPGGRADAVRLPVASGDDALVVGIDRPGAISPAQLAALTGTLAAQVR